MKTELIISPEPINEPGLCSSRERNPTQGAVITFTGIVRGTEDNRGIDAIHYESFDAMAKHQFDLIFKQTADRFPTVASVRLTHRVGRVDAGDASLWIEVVAPHRREAFEACLWIIEEMKRVVPIWKKPVWTETKGGSSSESGV